MKDPENPPCIIQQQPLFAAMMVLTHKNGHDRVTVANQPHPICSMGNLRDQSPSAADVTTLAKIGNQSETQWMSRTLLGSNKQPHLSHKKPDTGKYQDLTHNSSF